MSHHHSFVGMLEFTKMNGAGNDFIMIDNREGKISLSPEQIKNLCDRHRGIGADGLILCETESSNFRMRYHNADGNEVEMCGNGARCFTRYAARLTKQASGMISFQTQAGMLHGELLKEKVRLQMSQPHSLQLSHSLCLNGLDYEVHSINTGVPHVVIFVSALKEAPVVELGRLLRHHPRFAPAGTNANFVEVFNHQLIKIRTYERGVEDETMACGTGVVASAIIHHLITKAPSPISVAVQGGDVLEVDFKISTVDHSGVPVEKIALTGPADFVFEGSSSSKTPN